MKQYQFTATTIIEAGTMEEAIKIHQADAEYFTRCAECEEISL